MIHSFDPKRLEGETYEEYRERRKAYQWIEKKLRPRQRARWRTELVGTYEKKKVAEALERLKQNKDKDTDGEH